MRSDLSVINKTKRTQAAECLLRFYTLPPQKNHRKRRRLTQKADGIHTIPCNTKTPLDFFSLLLDAFNHGSTACLSTSSAFLALPRCFMQGAHCIFNLLVVHRFRSKSGFSCNISWNFANIWVNLSHIDSNWTTMSSLLFNLTHVDSMSFMFTHFLAICHWCLLETQIQ